MQPNYKLDIVIKHKEKDCFTEISTFIEFWCTGEGKENEYSLCVYKSTIGFQLEFNSCLWKKYERLGFIQIERRNIIVRIHEGHIVDIYALHEMEYIPIQIGD